MNSQWPNHHRMSFSSHQGLNSLSKKMRLVSSYKQKQAFISLMVQLSLSALTQATIKAFYKLTVLPKQCFFMWANVGTMTLVGAIFNPVVCTLELVLHQSANTPTFLLLLSEVSSSIKISKPIPETAMALPLLCLTDELVLFGSWADLSPQFGFGKGKS